MEKNEVKKKSSKTGYYLITAIAFIALGIVTIIYRGPITDMIDTILKWIVAAIFAIVAIVNIIKFAKTPGKGTIGDLILGIFAIIAMIALLIKPGLLLWLIGVLFGLYLIYEGIMKISGAFKAKKTGIKLWYLPLIFGIVSIILGAVLIYNTWKAVSFFVILVGILLIYAGVQNAVNLFIKSK